MQKAWSATKAVGGLGFRAIAVDVWMMDKTLRRTVDLNAHNMFVMFILSNLCSAFWSQGVRG